MRNIGEKLGSGKLGKLTGPGGKGALFQPDFVSKNEAAEADANVIPGTVEELSDPYRSSVVTKLGTFLDKTLKEKRAISEDENKGILAIKAKLEELKTDCEKNSRQDWLAFINVLLTQIGQIKREYKKPGEIQRTVRADAAKQLPSKPAAATTTKAAAPKPAVKKIPPNTVIKDGKPVTPKKPAVEAPTQKPAAKSSPAAKPLPSIVSTAQSEEKNPLLKAWNRLFGDKEKK